MALTATCTPLPGTALHPSGRSTRPPASIWAAGSPLTCRTAVRAQARPWTWTPRGVWWCAPMPGSSTFSPGKCRCTASMEQYNYKRGRCTTVHQPLLSLTIWNARRVRFAHNQRKAYFIIRNSGKSADFPELPFHERGYLLFFIWRRRWLRVSPPPQRRVTKPSAHRIKIRAQSSSRVALMSVRKSDTYSRWVTRSTCPTS